MGLLDGRRFDSSYRLGCEVEGTVGESKVVIPEQKRREGKESLNEDPKNVNSCTTVYIVVRSLSLLGSKEVSDKSEQT